MSEPSGRVDHAASRVPVVDRGRHFIWRVLRSVDLGTHLINFARRKRKAIAYGRETYLFSVPTWLCRYRANTFATKEPETLRWIDSFERGSILWDIGANVGLYSVYAAKARGCRVFAFEPSVFNLECLARNVEMNMLTERISLIPVAVSDGTSTGTLRMTSTELGGALSTFAKSYGSDGNALQQIFEYQTLAVSMDDAMLKLGLPAPDYIKIDVDGIEHLIVSGGKNVLRRVKGVLIEITENFQEQAEVSSACLSRAGLERSGPSPGVGAGGENDPANTVNQIWGRSAAIGPDARSAT